MKSSLSPASVLACAASSIVVALGLGLALPATAGTTVLASAESTSIAGPASCSERQPLTGLDARVVAKAAQGVDALRGFITVTRGVYGLDMESTVAWLDRQRAAETACSLAAVTGPRR